MHCMMSLKARSIAHGRIRSTSLFFSSTWSCVLTFDAAMLLKRDCINTSWFASKLTLYHLKMSSVTSSSLRKIVQRLQGKIPAIRSLLWMTWIRFKHQRGKKWERCNFCYHERGTEKKNWALDRNQTHDLSHASQMLLPLRYKETCCELGHFFQGVIPLLFSVRGGYRGGG